MIDEKALPGQALANEVRRHLIVFDHQYLLRHSEPSSPEACA
jgi:hypothetical protein